MTLFDKLTGTTAEGRLDYLERYIGHCIDEWLKDAQPDSFETWLLRNKLCNKGFYSTFSNPYPSEGQVKYFLRLCQGDREYIVVHGTQKACRFLKQLIGAGRLDDDGIILTPDASLYDPTRVWNEMGSIMSDYRWIAMDENNNYLGMMEIQQNQQTVRKYLKQLKELGIAVVEQR